MTAATQQEQGDQLGGFEGRVALARADLPMTPELYARRRTALLRFIAEQLVEAEYNSRGYPISGRCNDYYRVPGSTEKALTRKGAECLGDHFRYKVLDMQCVETVVQPDFVSVRARCTLHRSGHVVAVSEGVCTSVEKAFLKQIKQQDHRAFYNQIARRAQKRAYVNGMITACAAGDIFALAAEAELDDILEAEGEVVDETPVPPTPASKGGLSLGQIKQMLDITSAFTHQERSELVDWINGPAATRENGDRMIRKLQRIIKQREAGPEEEKP